MGYMGPLWRVTKAYTSPKVHIAEKLGSEQFWVASQSKCLIRLGISAKYFGITFCKEYKN